MRSTRFCSFSLLAVIALLAAPGFSQPEVTGISGEVPHGSHVTIQGRSFGVKSPAAPLRYFNFEDGAVGERIPSQGEGGFYNNGAYGIYPSYSKGKQRVPGETVCLQDYATGSNYNQTIGLQQSSEIDVSKLYITGWTYRHDVNGNAALSSNQKLWGNWSCKGEITGKATNPQCRIDTYFPSGKGHHYAQNYTNGDPTMMFQDYSIGDARYFNQWMRYERYMDQGSPGGNDGWSFAAANLDMLTEYKGNLYTSFNDNTFEGRYQTFLLCHYFRRTEGGTIKIYWGELYIDKTLARIEIGNASTWNACTHREIQIPASWSSNEITFEGNYGTFEPGSDLYVFVVNENNVPSPGYPVTLGGSAGDVNFAPVLDLVGPQAVTVTNELTFTATASDADLPPDTLTFSLDTASISAGMAIDPDSGLFTWTPTEAQGPDTFQATITVSDGSATDQETINIEVTGGGSSAGPGQPGQPIRN